MKRETLLTFFLIFFHSICFSQNEANIWYFGNNAGLDFNYEPPRALVDGMIDTNEGCTSVSDSNGNILFYSDGVEVYNKNHVLMENGSELYGNASSTQSAIIARLPGSQTVYYIFTTDAATNSLGLNGCNYSIVDLSYNNGLGKVTEKNKFLFSKGTEKVSGTLHFNGRDIWIVSHKNLSADFYAYLLTPSGLNTTPVITNIGASNYYLNGNGEVDELVSVRGAIKFSPDGTKLASTIEYKNLTELFDFDNKTGRLSNYKLLTDETNIDFYPYGIEFSPNSSKLYISSRTSDNKLSQFDLSQPDIRASAKHNIKAKDAPLNHQKRYAALQLAPNGKIYVSVEGSDYAGVINDPNSSSDINFIYKGANLLSADCIQGLPNVIQSYVSVPNIVYSFKCLGDTAFFNIVNMEAGDIQSTAWNFGDPSSGMNNNSTAKYPNHYYSDTGDYEVTVTITTVKGLSYFVKKRINVTDGPTFSGIKDTIYLCKWRRIPISAGLPGLSYEWSHTTDKNSIQYVTDTGKYWVIATNECGTKRKDFYIKQPEDPIISLKDTFFCEGSSFTVDIETPWAHYYKIGEFAIFTNQSKYEITKGGEYTFGVTNKYRCGVSQAKMKILEIPLLHLSIDYDGGLCLYDTLELTVKGKHNGLLWNAGDTTEKLIVTEPNTYSVRTSNICGVSSDTALISYDNTVTDFSSPDTAICSSDSLWLSIPPKLIYDSLKWVPMNTFDDSLFVGNGTYILNVYNFCGNVYDTITIDTLTYKKVKITDTTICLNDSLLINVNLKDYDSLRWLPNDVVNNQLYVSVGKYYLEFYNRCYIDYDTFNINAHTVPSYNAPRDTVLCGKGLLNLSLSDSNVDFKWSGIGITGSNASIKESGDYTVSLNFCDSIIEHSFNAYFGNEGLYVPNAFTPNDNGLNETFKPEGVYPYQDKYKLTVFNRWGELLYISNNVNEGWDGTYQNTPAMQGVYLYLISYLDCAGSLRHLSGSFTLLR